MVDSQRNDRESSNGIQMLIEITPQTLAEIEQRLSNLATQARTIRKTAGQNGLASFRANVGTLRHAIGEAEKFALRLEQAADRAARDKE